GLVLQNLGVPLSDEDERVGVYLTNALTGWKPLDPEKEKFVQLQLAGLPELQEERDAAEKIKRSKKILVVLGNPPYNSFAGMAVDEERDLSNVYRTTKKAPKPQGQGLNDLYTRFFRMAERQIVEETGKGVVCFISNYSWLDGLSFTGMRERYIERFDSIWIDNLHGDRIISEYAPDGRTSETVFAMQGTSVGIKIGTAISLLVAKDPKESLEKCKILYRDVDQARASERRKSLVSSLENADFDNHYTQLSPAIALGLPLKPRKFDIGYPDYPLLPELFPKFFPGVTTSRDGLVIDVDKETLIDRMKQYFNPSVSNDEIRRNTPKAMQRIAGFDPEKTRSYLCKRGFLPEKIVRYCYRPFDLRWLYWEPETNLLDRKREEYFPHISSGNLWIEARQKQAMENFDRGYVVKVLSDCFGNGRSSFFPLYLTIDQQQPSLFEDLSSVSKKTNLGDDATKYIGKLQTLETELFYHAIAILHSPAYRTENAGALKQDFPRIPLPDRRETLIASATLGRQIAALLDPETPVPGVTSGKPRPELKAIAVVSRVGTGNLDPNTDFALTAGWGHAGQNNVTMPGKGKVSDRPYTSEEQIALTPNPSPKAGE
ncbi:MAG: DNA methyltransferase, partial [Phormidesmis sp. CAN_BIN44]|nr:DNA methyltransferase [Phormidesmis sp. CAN_BIN44]